MREPSIHDRYYNAYTAYKNAKNPEFKELWWSISRALAEKL